MDEEIEAFLKENEICYDRFTFDKIFRFLLENDFEHEEAKDVILYNCVLSALVLQERIHNNYYYQILAGEEISDDLSVLKKEEEIRYLQTIITDAINRKVE